METVGDKYMAVSGLPEPCSSHAKCMAGLALDMMDLVDQIKYEDTSVVWLKILKENIFYYRNIAKK